MKFDYYQKEAAKTAIYPYKGQNLFYPALGLAGEAGELANKVKKLQRDQGLPLWAKILTFFLPATVLPRIVITDALRDALIKELGGILWYIAAICDELGVSMEDVARVNLQQLEDRKARGVLGGSGDER